MEVETAVTPGHVSNAQFMRDVMGPLAAGEYAWACHFAAPPNSALAEWGGFRVSEYAQVEDYKVNAYCSVAIVSDRRQGRHFIRMTCIVLDDSQPDPHASWVLETSPGNYQVGYIIWPAITDEGIASRLQKALSEQGLVKADQSGYSSVRYVRLPVGCNTKVSPPYPHRLLDWQPECIFTLDDLIEKFDLDADEILNPQTRIAPAQGAPSAPFADRRFTSEDSEYVRSIVMGDMYHDSLLALSARYVARGMPPAQVTEALRGMMQAREVRDDRWQARLEEIPRLVRGAAEKFTPQPGAEAAQAAGGIEFESLLRMYSHEPNPIDWVMDGWIAKGTVTTLYGRGGIGKSLLSLQLAASVALSQPLFGVKCTGRKVMALFCEDDRDELHRRIYRMSNAAGAFSIADVAAGIDISARAGMDNVLIEAGDSDAGVQVTGLFGQLSEQLASTQYDLLILDNIAQMMAVPESKRSVVTQAVNLLTRLAIQHKVAIVLLGHPAKATESEFSGSTAWDAAVRTRLLIERDKDDEDILHLRKAKANYSTRDDIEIRFDDGAYVLVDQANRSNIKKADLNNGEMAVRSALAAAKTIGQTLTLSRNSPSRFILKFIEARRPERHDATDESILAAARQMLARGDLEEVSGIDQVGRPKRFIQLKDAP
jgi:archaellum biogenesis ATPase FlaH